MISIKIGGRAYRFEQEAIDRAIKAEYVKDGIEILAKELPDKPRLRLMAWAKTAREGSAAQLRYLAALIQHTSLPDEAWLPDGYVKGAPQQTPPAPPQ